MLTMGPKVHNTFGEELFDARMQKVAHVPEVYFNLFSLTQRMKQGWKLGRDDESIWLDKGKKGSHLILSFQHQKGPFIVLIFAAKDQKLLQHLRFRRRLVLSLHTSCLGMVMRAVQEKMQQHWNLRLLAVH